MNYEETKEKVYECIPKTGSISAYNLVKRCKELGITPITVANAISKFRKEKRIVEMNDADGLKYERTIK
jgi:Fe2+ or Zn2+ uptake regulation protein